MHRNIKIQLANREKFSLSVSWSLCPHGSSFVHLFGSKNKEDPTKVRAPPAGLEPATSRLTAVRSTY